MENDSFYKDLNLLGQISEHHLLRWGTEGIEVFRVTPEEYFQDEKDNEDAFINIDLEKILDELNDEELGLGNFGGLIKSLYKLTPSGIRVNAENEDLLQKMFPGINDNSSMWDLMKKVMPFSKNLLSDKDYYKDFRKTISEKGFKLESNAGNWEVEEVIGNINQFLTDRKTNLTFKEFVDTCFKHKKEPASRYEYYTTAYLLLDMMGYKSDKLPKSTDNMMNIQTDADHSFYSAYCDYFVVLDKKLDTKSKVLFKEFNIPTVILSPDELIQVISSKMHLTYNINSFMEDAYHLIKKENQVEKYLKDDGAAVNTYAYQLPVFYFNFFNYAVIYDYSEQNSIILEFKKVFKNYSSFVYYSESERLLDRICNFFGYEDDEDFKLKKEDFVYGKGEATFDWEFGYGVIQVSNDLQTQRPLLKYVIKISGQ
ncbi:hypothetical protein [Niabella aquatica]